MNIRPPYIPVEVSRAESGEILNPPANGEAIGIRLNDDHGNYHAYLIEWQSNPDAWIAGDNNVSLSANI